MYSASATFNTKIKSNTRGLHWSGTITANGNTYSLSDDDLISGSITRSISSQSLSIGTAYASTLSMEFILPGVSRYELYNGNIDVSVTLDGATDVIPMGKYIISEAMQTSDHITIKAYDNMVKLDNVPFNPSSNTNIQTPYAWLSDLCTACGVVLGSTSTQISALPNGNRQTGFADAVSDVKSWRDVLGYLTAYLNGYAYIGRDGKLYIGKYTANSADTIPSNFRYTSNLSDFRTTYNGLYSVFKEGGVQEYVSNSNTGGIVLDLGTNPFLQFTDQTNRLEALQEIIDAWNGVYYVPYESDLPLVPTYDPGDVLTFTDNQAGAYDIGAITEITYNIGGTMNVKCSGDNPRLATAQDRITKSVAGLSADYNNGAQSGSKNFWLLETTNTSEITVGNTKTQIAVIEWSQSVDVQKMGFMFCCEANLSATAVISIVITVDDSDDYVFNIGEEKALKGKRPFSRNCGFRVSGKGTHSAKVYMTVTNSPTLVGDLF